MKRSFLVVLNILIFSLFLLPISAWAAFFEFDQTSLNVNSGDKFQVSVLIDTEGEEVNAAQAYVRFDSNLLSVDSVAAGDFFDEVSYEINTDNVYIAGLLSNIGVGKSGQGKLAAITFQANSSGAITLDFICDTSVRETSSIIKQEGVDTIELINCSSNGTLAIDINGASGETVNAPASTAGDSSAPGESNGVSTPKGGADANQASKELPKAGAADHLFLYLLSGGFLLLVGIGLKNLR